MAVYTQDILLPQLFGDRAAGASVAEPLAMSRGALFLRTTITTLSTSTSHISRLRISTLAVIPVHVPFNTFHFTHPKKPNPKQVYVHPNR